MRKQPDRADSECCRIARARSAKQFVGITMIGIVKVDTRNVREMDKFPDGCAGVIIDVRLGSEEKNGKPLYSRCF
jgi:hypothetical protein